jgi:hypothetical protein
MKQNMKPVLVMALIPCLCSAAKQHCNGCIKKYFPENMSAMSTTHKTKSDECSNDVSTQRANERSSQLSYATSFKNDLYFPEVTRVRVCQEHKISMCPVCNSDDYAQRRVCNVVASALKRLNIKKTRTYLEYLGADSWSQVLRHLAFKRKAWNSLHPDVPMTLTNTALDHIRPVSSFKQNSVGVQTLMCNHYTNLQPLLHEDNSWKGESWSLEDEKYWHENIIMHPFYQQIYYPKSAPSQPSLLRPAAERCI